MTSLAKTLAQNPMEAVELPGIPKGRTLASEVNLALGERGRSAKADEELRSILTLHKRFISLAAMVPFWGPWQLSRSAEHSASEKLGLTIASVALTVLLVVGLLLCLPNDQERVSVKRQEVAKQLDALAELVHDYAREHGAMPDRETWLRSAERGDLRFYDPWGRVYRYELADEHARISTLGRDAQAGGGAEDTDVERTVEIRREPADAAASG